MKITQICFGGGQLYALTADGRIFQTSQREIDDYQVGDIERPVETRRSPWSEVPSPDACSELAFQRPKR